MKKGNTDTKPFDNPVIRFVAEPKYRLLRHILFLLLGFVLAFKGDIGNHFKSVAQRNAVWTVDTISFLFIMAVIYLLNFLFVPKFLFRSRLLLFSLSFFFCIVLVYVCVTLLDQYILVPVNPAGMQHIEFSIINFVQVGAVCAVMLGAVVGIKIFQKWINDLKRMNELQQINLKTELEQLKSQVNPHFLFNTLNNLFVLMKTDTEKASQVLLGLSDLLRYQLYDSTKEKISLSKDIAFIQNLLVLEKIRKNDFSFTIHTSGNIDGQMLPPFLFIPFVENAIKHGASTVGASYLNLDFGIADNKLYFIAENSKPLVKQNTIGGLGLANIKRRLGLLYPDRKYTLETIDKPDKYTIHLILPL